MTAQKEDGQIVLSREEARRQRWEYILEHCEEGSIVEGKVIRSKGGLMVNIGMKPSYLVQIDNKRIKTLMSMLITLMTSKSKN